MTLGLLRRRLQRVTPKFIVDIATPESTVFLSGMGRSGTTWVAEAINHDGTHRIVFEPFNPHKVKEARSFEYVQYLSRDYRDLTLMTSAQRILSGQVRNRWVDVENRTRVFRRRIIKDIRSNLMLAWLSSIAPRMPIVLLIRHPLSVAMSWHRLGWGAAEKTGWHRDCEVMLSQKPLIDAFPVIGKAAKRVDIENELQRIVFQWCVMHYVPLQQLQPGEYLTVFYEDLVLNPQREFEILFQYLRVPFKPNRLASVLCKPSMTHQRAPVNPRGHLTRWRQAFTSRQIEQASSILSMFGLDHLYVDGIPATATGTHTAPRIGISTP